MLKFDAETAKILDNAYQGADVTARRLVSYNALSPNPGETLLDIGCGNGLLTLDLARATGPEGRVVGIDPSADMRKVAAARCAGQPHVTFRDGLAGALPVEDGVADGAVALQVFEYVEDLGTAMRDAMRCLKPGGRLVIGDLHFGSFIWHSENLPRMARMRAAWDHHFVHADLPTKMLPLLKEAGHRVEAVRPFTTADHCLRPGGLARMMMHLMTRYAVENGHVSQDEADDWFAEQEDLARRGHFFFSLSQFVITARKTGS
ncbi:methyltransferase domain-containing protein [Sulfitobacter mediterraneus]|uniref:methyltransferase domain-containing protein n=1 Tax=Sulfitobacter mediterraneus TaxID=83219 RepID=UPI0019339372|nr:methyltransferase domain-containing protein [Sulfitobacter mediterraneus]MBM1632320.1 methyltransferase domain-containing protein [Sulfitobacter mediterraneus]MBM1640136.1 methyltransferase domain-containing protein [Sulfitobacter mediterraneus]MBM1644185.1 methyltransferase domain-containing protein [Sulfitobacter mediterraneus]MBM1648231.1 methyltransferase domain-containing protein [Sulfitobacter mediterraneus]MBM1652276.1 methyltransferase domain-containing protein [Sulfitobacter medite